MAGVEFHIFLDLGQNETQYVLHGYLLDLQPFYASYITPGDIELTSFSTSSPVEQGI